MIILNLRGGLGNQMFQYAYAFILAKQNQDRIYLSAFYQKREDIDRGIRINKLNCSNYRVLPENIDLAVALWMKLKLIVVERFICGKNNLHGKESFYKAAGHKQFVTRDIYQYFGYPKASKGIINVDGFFQSGKYFVEYEDEIRCELRVSDSSFQGEENIRTEREIQSCNAVCLHIRRGDYASERWKKSLLICGKDYYKQAIEYIKERVEHPVFYVFSNDHEDIEWIKREYHFDDICNLRYVDNGNADVEDLRLMYGCRHFILSNSSFSWWAQYLSENKKKYVVAPGKWTNEQQDFTDVYEDTWKIIPVEG